MTNIVYLTLNTVNRKIYVGVHSTKNDKVFDGYIGCGVFTNKSLKSPKTPFQYAVKKYGFKAFERITLFRCDTIEEALEIERMIVNESFLKRPDVYNAILGGGLPPRLNKEVYQYSLDGSFIAEYDSVEEASKKVGAAFSGCISNALAYKTVSFGYLWSFKKTKQLNMEDFRVTIQKIEVHVYNKNGTYLKSFETLVEAAKELGTKHSVISDAIKSGRSYNNYYFSSHKLDTLPIKKEFNSTSKIYQYTLEGKYITFFDNRKALKKSLNISTTGLADAIYKSFPFQGYRWSLEKKDVLENLNDLRITSKGKKIGRYTKSGELIQVYNTVRECRKEYGNVSKVLKGTVSHCKNFVFKYIE